MKAGRHPAQLLQLAQFAGSFSASARARIFDSYLAVIFHHGLAKLNHDDTQLEHALLSQAIINIAFMRVHGTPSPRPCCVFVGLLGGRAPPKRQTTPLPLLHVLFD